MNILVLNGSPRKNGNTAQLIQSFTKGAKEAGHTVKIETVAQKQIHGCTACEYCRTKGAGTCIQKDDMQAIYPKIMWADMLVMASPIYYYTMTGQMQSALQRTYSIGQLTHLKKAALILSSGAPNMYDAVQTQYRGIIDWWGVKDAGIFTVPGMTRSHEVNNTSGEWLTHLYQFGKNLEV